MKSIIWSVVVLGSTLAFAGGKPQRKAFEARIAEARKDFKAACGCDLAVTVKWDTFKSDDDFMQSAATLPDVSSSESKPCDDKAGKLAVCKLKTLEVSFAGSGELAAPVIAGTTAKVTANRQEASGFDNVTDLLDPGGPRRRAKIVQHTEALGKAARSFQAHCGCSITFDIDWASFATTDHLARVGSMADSFSSIGSTWQDRCVTPESRANMCKLKTVKYRYVEGSPDAAKAPAFANGVMTAVTDGMYGPGIDEMMPVLDPR